jgi:putrescine aminotransferase
LAVMCAFRASGRNKLLAYQHGYHGHTGFAALATGSLDEGVIDHYNMPAECVRFAPTYGDLAALEPYLTREIGAFIIEPMDYETFVPASADFLNGVARLCRERGIVFILDETRTGLARTGKLWAAEHFGVRPDMLITGKGLSGGIYPVSAILMTAEMYDDCINGHRFSYISSLGGNEIACAVAQRVLQLSSSPEILQNVQAVAPFLWHALTNVAAKHTTVVASGTQFGFIQTLKIRDRSRAMDVFRAFNLHGVLCHSVSTIDPCVIKFFSLRAAL